MQTYIIEIKRTNDNEQAEGIGVVVKKLMRWLQIAKIGQCFYFSNGEAVLLSHYILSKTGK